MPAIDLNRANLSKRQPPVRTPGFDPARVSPGIVHLGLGGVHRAHMARYTHNLMERDPAALDWGIVGAGSMPADERMADALHPQDDLYPLVERDSAGETISPLLDAIDDARVKIVSLTSPSTAIA